MIILGIESSCDETGAAVLSKVGDRIEILSNIVASSSILQSKFGGIIPEQAAREQIKSIIPVIEEALTEAKVKPSDLDAIAVTYGPGLIGSLLVGTEAAKTLAWVWDKPLIGINHLLGHFYANWIEDGSSPQGRTIYSSTSEGRAYCERSEPACRQGRSRSTYEDIVTLVKRISRLQPLS
jgi:N6-L-threonylcarbamoyladenine synthase